MLSNRCYIFVPIAVLILFFENNYLAYGKIKIFVSILPQKYFVEKIGGDRVEVSVMIGPGYSHGNYEPLPQQMMELAKAQVYFRIGVLVENSLIKKIQSINPMIQFVDTRKGITLRDTDSFSKSIGISEADDVNKDHSEFHEVKDPHIWLSPELVKIQARTITETLCKADNGNGSFYNDRLSGFLKELDDLNHEIRNALSSIRNKKMMVFHPAWGYFADQYGFTQIPIEIGGKEPTPKQLSKIIAYAKREQIRIIFIQAQYSARSAKAIAEEIGAFVIPIDPLAENYIENLRQIAFTISRNLK